MSDINLVMLTGSSLPTLVKALTEMSVTLVPGVSDGMVNVVLKSMMLVVTRLPSMSL